MTVNMNEMNGNEKYYDLPENFRADSPSPAGTIRAGDLMCWSSNCLALFYKASSSGYSYVRLDDRKLKANYSLAIDPGRTAFYTLCEQKGVSITVMKTLLRGNCWTRI
jgi:hypothetical protein